HCLRVAVAVLHWMDEATCEILRSPLVLVPVELVRSSLREPFKLQPLDEDAIVDPALAARLVQDFDFRLPATPEAWDETDIASYFAQVQSAIAGLPGWSIEPSAFLALFSFFKGVMYRDLEDNAAV